MSLPWVWFAGALLLAALLAHALRNPTRELRRRLKYRWWMWRAESYWRDLRVVPVPRGRLRIIATLTTSPERIGLLRPVLDSLTRGQTRPPDEIHLNVPHRFGRTGQAYEIPGFLAEYGVQVHRCDDVGPGTKIIPTIRRLQPDEDVWLLVVDDDVRHLPDAVATLEAEAESNPAAAHGYADNYLYRKWVPGQPVDFLCGFAGFIVHRSFFGADFEDYLAKVLPNRDCFFQDDIYLCNYLAARGVERHRVSTPEVGLRRMERLGCLLEQGASEGSLALGAGSGLNTHDRSAKVMEHLGSLGLAAIHPGARPARLAALPGWLKPVGAGPMMRMGREHDGGYVLPVAALESSDGLLSLGINDDWSLDRDFAGRKPGAPIVAYDPTISQAGFVTKALSRTLPYLVGCVFAPARNFPRLRRVWSVALGYRRFFGNRARHHRLWITGQPGPGARTLGEALADPIFARCRSLFVKMDIEGAEYESFGATPPADLANVGLLAVEFHQVCGRLADLKSLAEGLATDFAVAHVHANNCGDLVGGVPDVLEVVWVRRSLLPGLAVEPPALPIPGLDQANTTSRPDIALRFGA